MSTDGKRPTTPINTDEIEAAIAYSKKPIDAPAHGEAEVDEWIRAVIGRFNLDHARPREALYTYTIDILNRLVARSAALLQLNALIVATTAIFVAPVFQNPAGVLDYALIALSLFVMLVLITSSFLTIDTIRLVWYFRDTVGSALNDFAATQRYNARRGKALNMALSLTKVGLAAFLLSWVVFAAHLARSLM